jgi:hypothetical protein
LSYFWQYGCVADEDYMKQVYKVNDFSARKLGISKLMHLVNDLTLREAARALSARRTKFSAGQSLANWLSNLVKSRPGSLFSSGNVPALGEIWESEEKGFGESDEDIKFTTSRLVIHNRSGGRVMMGVNSSTGKYINLHLQPRLTKDSEPIALHLMFRSLDPKSTDFTKVAEDIDKQLAKDIVINGFLANFIKEGFDKNDVDDAIKEVSRRFDQSSRIILLPATMVPNAIEIAETDELFCKQLLKMYGLNTLDEAKKKFEDAVKE